MSWQQLGGASAACRPACLLPLSLQQQRVQQQQRSRGFTLSAQPQPRRRQRAFVATVAPTAAAAAAQPQGADGGEPTGAQRRGTSGSLSADPQPLLQAWLQREQQGLPADEADQHARRLAQVFGSEQAALDGLPATFAWCRGPGNKVMTGLQAAQLLDRIAETRWDNVVNFSSSAQVDWQLIDGCISAYVERQAGGRPRKHTSLAEVLCSSPAAAKALVMPPGHVAAWLEAVQQRLPAADLGGMLVSLPGMVAANPATSVAAIDWVEEALRPKDLAAFFRKADALLKSNPDTLAATFANLQQAAVLTAEQARELALKQPRLLSAAPDTVQQSAAWLRQQFPDPVQLFDVLMRGPLLLTISVDDRLQRNTDYLQHELEWSAGGGQLAAFIKEYPEPYAMVDYSSAYVQSKLLFLTEVVGVDLLRCLSSGGNYLKRSLNSMAATYVLVKEQAPTMLRGKDGEASLSWIMSKRDVVRNCGITASLYNDHMSRWPSSKKGKELLEELSEVAVDVKGVGGVTAAPPRIKARAAAGWP